MYLFKKFKAYFLGILLLFVACFTIFNIQTVQASSINIYIVEDESISKEVDQQNVPSAPIKHPKLKFKKVIPSKRWSVSTYSFYRQNLDIYIYIPLLLGISPGIFVPISSNFSSSLLAFLSLHILM
ncbi:MAG: hypothetical protein ACOVNY_06040 [Chitinophagaceae bacterium]|jgi:hypothetical protein